MKRSLKPECAECFAESLTVTSESMRYSELDEISIVNLLDDFDGFAYGFHSIIILTTKGEHVWLHK